MQRSKTVDAAIKRSYAMLAKKHFVRAEISVTHSEEIPGKESDIRMAIVECYLDKAGANAVKYYY